MQAELTQIPDTYTPERLLDTLIDTLRLKNDAALARELGVTPAVISRIRHKKMAIGATILLTMHEVSFLGIRDLRSLMGDRRRHFRNGYRPLTQPDHASVDDALLAA